MLSNFFLLVLFQFFLNLEKFNSKFNLIFPTFPFHLHWNHSQYPSICVCVLRVILSVNDVQIFHLRFMFFIYKKHIYYGKTAILEQPTKCAFAHFLPLSLSLSLSLAVYIWYLLVIAAPDNYNNNNKNVIIFNHHWNLLKFRIIILFFVCFRVTYYKTMTFKHRKTILFLGYMSIRCVFK